MRRVFQFILAMVLAFIPGVIGAMFSPHGPSDVWYNALSKSVLTPDGWVFALAWTILYALIGVALFLVIRNDKTRRSKTPAYLLFLVQMVLNAMWSYMFFGLHLAGAALIVLIGLIGITIWMMSAFHVFDKWASYLLWPYLLWMLFATYLNVMIILLN